MLLGSRAQKTIVAASCIGKGSLAEKGRLEIVQLLLASDADVNAPASNGNSGRTAHQAAVDMNNIRIVPLLLESGADVNAPGDGDHGRTALRAAAENDNVQMVQLLLDSGAEVNSPARAGHYGTTALQEAI
jgi:ankyrin repeat protein